MTKGRAKKKSRKNIFMCIFLRIYIMIICSTYSCYWVLGAVSRASIYIEGWERLE
jgi:hypothetical protein